MLHMLISGPGGLWVLIELDNEGSKQKFLDHVGVNSWFCTLLNAYNDFVSDECVVWVDIEGIPLHVWSRETFAKIGNKWGEALDIEDNFGSSFARKRLCILTKQPESILEKFKNSDVESDDELMWMWFRDNFSVIMWMKVKCLIWLWTIHRRSRIHLMEKSVSSFSHKVHNGGSYLDILDDMQPCHDRLNLNAPFHNRLSSDQVDELDRAVSRDEIRKAVWNCGENKSPASMFVALDLDKERLCGNKMELLRSQLLLAGTCVMELRGAVG
ncbi:RNA-directed DNA polymerase, eukaryota [Tanacetum coccineum]